MRFLAFFVTLSVSLAAFAAAPGKSLWMELQAKREKLPGFHQEFEATKTAIRRSSARTTTQQVVVDVSGEQWRERSATGPSIFIRLFDGKDLFRFEDGGDEYERVAHKDRGNPSPGPYDFPEADWSRIVELAREPCGIPGSNHQCALMEAPIYEGTQRDSTGRLVGILGGKFRVAVDMETGLLMSTLTVIETDDRLWCHQ